MSYCRWSSDNWRSDVYVYAHADGTWTTHVAGNRVVGAVPAVPRLTKASIADGSYEAAHKRVHAFLSAAEHRAIGLPHDGETFKDDTPQECAATLRKLRDAGYHVAEGVIEELDAEVVEA